MRTVRNYALMRPAWRTCR